MDKKFISDNKRVILITGDKNKWYEQAIFIVRKNPMETVAASDLIAEAEMIINNYIHEPHSPAPAKQSKGSPVKTVNSAKKQKSTFDVVVNALIIIAATVLLTMLARNMFG